MNDREWRDGAIRKASVEAASRDNRERKFLSVCDDQERLNSCKAVQRFSWLRFHAKSFLFRQGKIIITKCTSRQKCSLPSSPGSNTLSIHNQFVKFSFWWCQYHSTKSSSYVSTISSHYRRMEGN